MLKEAGRIMRTAKDIESKDCLTEKGSAANLVTLYDVKVQGYLIDRITKAIPDAVFIAEEKDNSQSEIGAEHCFIIDPIDGTANFTRNFNHSCISLAVISRGIAVYGAIYDPYLDEMFTAEKGKGMTVNGSPVFHLDHDVAHSLILFGTSPYKKTELGDKTFAIARKLFDKCADVRRCGSAALDLAYLAAGRADGFFELVLSPWDFAAGMLMVEEAGGVVTDLEGNRPSFTSTSPIIAGYGEIYRFILKTAKEIC